MHDLSKFQLPHDFRGRSAIYVQLWWLAESLLFRPSPQILYGWRRTLLRIFGAGIGKGVRIRSSARITYPWKVDIGEYAWIGDDVTIYSLGRVSIGRNTVVSQKAYLCAGGHKIESASFEIFSAPITVGASVWLAADVFVGPGVSIGAGAVVGARSTVLNDLPGMVVSYGNPAQQVRERLMEDPT